MMRQISSKELDYFCNSLPGIPTTKLLLLLGTKGSGDFSVHKGRKFGNCPVLFFFSLAKLFHSFLKYG